MRLRNKTAIITGGGSGFGAGIAKSFSKEGARVIVADIDLKKAAKIAKEYYKGTTAWLNENGGTCMFFGAAELHFVNNNEETG